MSAAADSEPVGHDGSPLIGVTTTEVRPVKTLEPIPRSEPPRDEMALGLNYLKAIESAGGVPVVIPPLAPEAIEPLLRGLAGLCLSGGPDIHPSAYGHEEHPELGPTWPDLDRAELAVAREADARGTPILAICRGAQTLNVARGGTLIQHLPDHVGTDVEHRQSGIGPQPSHAVEIEPDSLLARVVGTTRIEVNSFHHQAPDRLGRGLRATATAPDGVVEAIEDPERDFVLGVQWHAEALSERPDNAELFRAFVEAARATA